MTHFGQNLRETQDDYDDDDDFCTIYYSFNWFETYVFQDE